MTSTGYRISTFSSKGEPAAGPTVQTGIGHDSTVVTKAERKKKKITVSSFSLPAPSCSVLWFSRRTHVTREANSCSPRTRKGRTCKHHVGGWHVNLLANRQNPSMPEKVELFYWNSSPKGLTAAHSAHFTVVVLLDLKSAFDTGYHSIIIAFLHDGLSGFF